jgi:hypothetical protein
MMVFVPARSPVAAAKESLMARKDDPYYDLKNYHLAVAVNGDGEASALCYKSLNPIRLTKGQSWVLEPSRVTCPRCRKLLDAPESPLADYRLARGTMPYDPAAEQPEVLIRRMRDAW